MLEQNGLVGDAAAQRAKSRDFIFPDPLAFTQVSQQISRIFDIDDQGCFWGGERGESKDGSVAAPRENVLLFLTETIGLCREAKLVLIPKG
jgi:hypothetical protein